LDAGLHTDHNDPQAKRVAPHDPPETASDVGTGWVRALARGLGPFLRPHARVFVIVGLLMALELASAVGQRKAMSYLLDEAILKGDYPLMLTIIAIMFGVAVLAGGAALIHEYIFSGLCARIPGEVRARLFQHIQHLPLQRLRTARHGDLASRITNDAGSVEPALWSIGYIAIAVGGIVFSLAMLAWTEWRLTLVGVVLLPLALIGPKILSPRAVRESYATRTGIGDLATHLHENLANQIILRVFGLAKMADARFAERNRRIVHTARRYNIFSYYSHRIPYLVVELLELLMLALGGWMVVRGELTPGQLVAFYLLFSGLCSHTWSLTAHMPSLISAASAMRRVHEVLDEPVSDAKAVGRIAFGGLGDGIHFEAVSFSYEGERNQVESASLDIPTGSVVALVGGSGSGKSTALQLLLGLQAPNAGRIRIGNQDLRDIRLEEFWSRVSCVFQDSLLFHASMAANIRCGQPNATDEEVARAARAAEIDDWIRTLPEGYNTIVAGDTCSGGQRQRLALARALVRDPALLVLDEPTSALDAATGASVMQTLRRVASGRTVVLVTHHLGDAAQASQIIVFDGGRIAEHGAHDELLARGGVYAALWAQQRNLPDTA
jgi:ATP-binding cassette, subfamily B, bacterial